MSSQEILAKAIEKAIAGGWQPFSFDIASVDYRKGRLERNVIIQVHATDGDIHIMYNLEAIMFNHDFAKALWGDKRINAERHIEASGYAPMKLLETLPAWQYHLQMMVISEDPIKYLGENLDD